jgi:hypothetical protein
MSGTYYKVADDGARFRCRSCEELKEHTDVIVFEHTKTKDREMLCLDCVDREWLDTAKCLGTL